MTYIQNIATASPKNKLPQNDILDFMLSTVVPDEERAKKLMSIISKKSGISFRHTVLNSLNDFFLDGKAPDISDRMQVFHREGLNLAVEAIQKCVNQKELKEVTHLITVSCTGLSAPGIEIAIMKKLQLKNTLVRTAVNFMGCYAAFHALRIADQICKSTPNAKVLIVDIELCSLHFQNKKDEDNIMANTIFADGVAAVYLSNEKTESSLYEIDNFFSKLLLEGEEDMAWELTTTGFQMKLSTYIPQLIQKEITSMLVDTLSNTKFKQEDLQWAFHPGGIRILDAISKALCIPKEMLSNSYDVLNENGNMSSATVLFVLLMLAKQDKKGPVFSAGFGPGLTMEAMTLIKL